MSRTDKDRPWQLRIADPTGTPRSYYQHSDSAHAAGECDAHITAEQRYRERKSFHRWWNCGWNTSFWAFQPGPPRDYRNSVWYEPERMRERVQLRNLAREYNAHGDLAMDGDFPNYQHRHNASWYWW